MAYEVTIGIPVYNVEKYIRSYRRIEQFDGEERTIDYQYPLLVFLEENQFADRIYSDYSFLLQGSGKAKGEVCKCCTC